MSTRAATRMVRTESKTGIPSDEVVFGRSAAMEEVRQKALKICRTDVTVLLTGEGGTGKEVLARWLHANSRFASGEFVKVNCAAIPGSLLESELFGHEKGAFTGANASKPRRVEIANGGRLFRVEIAEETVAAHAGRLFGEPHGDDCLAEFPTAADAIACAVALQRETRSLTVTD